MKKFFVLFAVLVFILNTTGIFAQEAGDDRPYVSEEEDERPYLTDEDIEAIEMVLPFDEPETLGEDQQIAEAPEDEPQNEENETEETEETEEAVATEGEANEISRLNASQPIYHLLILDRTYAPRNSDIDGTDNIQVLYKFLHGTDGYLIAIYKTSEDGPVFPVLPPKSRIVVNLMSVQKSMIRDYVNSSAFRRLVTHRTVLPQLKTLFETDW